MKKLSRYVVRFTQYVVRTRQQGGFYRIYLLMLCVYRLYRIITSRVLLLGTYCFGGHGAVGIHCIHCISPCPFIKWHLIWNSQHGWTACSRGPLFELVKSANLLFGHMFCDAYYSLIPSMARFLMRCIILWQPWCLGGGGVGPLAKANAKTAKTPRQLRNQNVSWDRILFDGLVAAALELLHLAPLTCTRSAGGRTGSHPLAKGIGFTPLCLGISIPSPKSRGISCGCVGWKVGLCYMICTLYA